MDASAENAVLVSGAVSLDLRRYIVRIGDESWPVGKRDAELLRYFMEAAGRVVSREELKGVLWGQVEVSSRAVETALTRLRRALRERSVGRVIRTVHSSGYQFTGVPEPFRAKTGELAASITRTTKRITHEATHSHR
jgi:DNA-binding winged helix-turn-helix (wHTH) protein